MVSLVFALPYGFATPDVVMAELGAELGGMLSDQGLMIVPTPLEASEAWVALRLRYSHPSDADL